MPRVILRSALCHKKGISRIGDTALYLHLSKRHLQAVPSPLEAIEVSSPEEVKRSRRLMK